MNTSTKLGIDIAKKTFQVALALGQHATLPQRGDRVLRKVE